MTANKIATCLWFNGQAEEAAHFYAATFPDSQVGRVNRSPRDYPSGKAGDVITVEFTVLGQDFLGLNGGPNFTFDEAISFQVYTDDQAETDRLWNAIIADGGEESVCGWCKDKFGLSWQVVPHRLHEMMTSSDTEAGARAMGAMMEMRKIDIAALEAAFAGGAGGMSLQLFGHPFSSYTWKALIPLYENDTPFTFRMLSPEHPENGVELNRLSPMGKFPLLVDGDAVVFEATSVIEYLDAFYPGAVRMIPADPAAALKVRMLDRVFDNYVMNVMQGVVGDALRPAEHRDPYGVERAKADLERIYAWLDGELAGRIWAAGNDFTLADCAAAGALFYADWTHPIDARFVTLKDYRARLLARPSIARTVDEARPYRPYFPLGAPDRD